MIMGFALVVNVSGGRSMMTVVVMVGLKILLDVGLMMLTLVGSR